MKWLMAHYHACCAITRVRKLERVIDRFNRITYGRLNNFNVWLDSLCKEMEFQAKSNRCTKEQADHNSTEIDRLESIIRDLEAKLETAIGQMHQLSRAVELHNGAGKLMHQQIDELHSKIEKYRLPLAIMEPSRN